MQEIWKEIKLKGLQGEYKVSNIGNVLSLNYNKTGIPRLMTKTKHGRGYLVVGLPVNGKNTQFKVHRLVAEAFIPNPDNLPMINHRNEVKTDNRVENLEWCDAKYNSNYGTRNQRLSKNKNDKAWDSKPVLQFTLDGKFIKEWPSMMELKRNGFHNISYACNGHYNQCYGFKWCFKNPEHIHGKESSCK